jgi:hypothetical protein
MYIYTHIADAMNTTSAKPRNSADLNRERMVELTHNIGLEAKRLAISRGQLSKQKVGYIYAYTYIYYMCTIYINV